MKALFSFLITFSIFASTTNQQYALTHGEPASMIEGCVSTITGGLYLNQPDIVVRGREPIEFSKQYIHKNYQNRQGGWNLFGYSVATHTRIGSDFLISDGKGLYFLFYLEDVLKANKLAAKKKTCSVKA